MWLTIVGYIYYSTGQGKYWEMNGIVRRVTGGDHHGYHRMFNMVSLLWGLGNVNHERRVTVGK